MSVKRSFEIATLVLFAAGLCLPVAKGHLWGEDASVLAENRRLSAAPDFDWSREALERFPRAFESYYDDHFGLRSWLVGVHHSLLLGRLGASPTEMVMVGRDGFLFFAPSITREVRRMRAAELSRMEDVLRHLSDLRPGLRVVLAVVPNKASIYPEKLPRGVRYDDDGSRLSRVRAFLRRRAPEIGFVEMREELRAAKERSLVYLKGDTHWSHVGQLIAFESFVRVIGEWFPSLANLEPPRLEPMAVRERKGDLRIHLSDVIPVEREARYAIESPSAAIVKRTGRGESSREVWSRAPNDTLPKAVILHDSFLASHRLVHGLLRESFAELYTIQRQDNASPARLLERIEELVITKEADVLILEVVERNIDKVADWRRHIDR